MSAVWPGAITFGPVPSRRLGRSLGINTVPPNTCTMSCVYCQLGRTRHMTLERFAGAPPDQVEEAVARALEAAHLAVDALTLVADGEPTLDSNLGETLRRLRVFGLDVAVLTNASLLAMSEVREELQAADWVSLKVDGGSEAVWRQVDRPHGRLAFADVVDGMLRFALDFGGELATETMLVAGVNDSVEAILDIAEILAGLEPEVAWLGVPVRPPAEHWVGPPGLAEVERARDLLLARLPQVELMSALPEGDIGGATGLDETLMAVTAVHPLDEDAVERLLRRHSEGRGVIGLLLADGRLAEMEYRGRTFLTRGERTR